MAAVRLKSEFDLYSITIAGEALTKFLSNIRTIETNIGEYRKSYQVDLGNMIVTGVEVHQHQNNVDRLSPISSSLEVNYKFNSLYDKSPLQLLKYYLSISNIDRDEQSKLIERLRNIMNNKEIIYIFKVGEDVLCNIGTGSKKHKDAKGSLECLVFDVNRDINKFETTLYISQTKLGKASGIYKFNIEDYGTKFKICGIEDALRSSNIDREVIRVSRFGYIKPIELQYKNSRLAIDCYGEYYVSRGKIYVVGRWVGNKLIEADKFKEFIKDNKMYKYLKKNFDYIQKHVNYIAPYKLVESNNIKIN